MVVMEVLLERCAGLDVHQASVVCCVLIGAPGRRPHRLLRSFGTTTRELEALRAWLAEHGVTHVGMESTGVYWKPVYAVQIDRTCRGRYEALRARGHSYGRALRGVGDRLLGVACVLLQRQTLFDPDHGAPAGP